MARKITTEIFIREAREIHGDRYDYSLAEYVASKAEVTIICLVHGAFRQLPGNHLRGRGCKACSMGALGASLRLSQEAFIERAASRWGGTLDFSKSVYETNETPVTVTCPAHGDFSIRPRVLLAEITKKACHKCAKEEQARSSSKTKTKAFGDFVLEARKIFGGLYEYSEEGYKNCASPIIVTCPVHGPFKTTPNNHLIGHGCKKCATDKSKLPLEEFLKRAEEAHGSSLTYSNYTSVSDLVTITCPVHGDFERIAWDHLNSTGCPQCQPHKGRNGSLTELELLDFVQSIDPSARRGDRSIINPKELDIVSDQTKTAFEFCGLFWHSDYLPNKNLPSLGPKRHLIKLERAKAAGYRLFTVFEDEWANRQDAVKTLVARALSPEKLPTIGARSCELFTPSWEEAAAFYNQYHLQGATPGTVHLGLRKGDLTLAVMTVGKRSLYGKVAEGDWEMIRFCLNPAYNVPGAMSKLCAWLPSHLDVKRLFSFVDRRWFTGGSYVSAGFTLVKTTEPGYWYVRGLKRESRYKYAKHKLPGLLENFDPALTEVENMRNHGWNRIFDCGQLRFEKTY